MTVRHRYNESQRFRERERLFNVRELKRLAAEAVCRKPEDVVDFYKIGEGAANRVFAVHLRDGFRLVARVPYPATEPKGLIVASEAATIAFLRSRGFKVPQGYGYSASPRNSAQTEYIFMEFSPGRPLDKLWFEMSEQDRVAFVSSLVEMEACLFDINLPAYGSLYHLRDLPDDVEKVAVDPKDSTSPDAFYIGPSTHLSLWFGRRYSLSVDRGPCKL